MALVSGSFSTQAQETTGVTSRPAENGKTLVRGFGVQGLCPPGWKGEQDGDYARLRFTSPNGRAYIVARTLDFALVDEKERRLVLDWVKNLGAKNIRSIEGTVEFITKTGSRALIDGFGEDLPALWMEYQEDPKSSDKGINFAAMIGSIQPDKASGAKIAVPPYDGYPDDLSAAGDCYRVIPRVAAFRAAPRSDAQVWTLLPKGSVLYQGGPTGKGEWIDAGEIDTRGDGLAYVYRIFAGEKGYVHKNDVRRERCNERRH
ncbi:MAG: hypothetical protein IJM72_06255 [Deltaproteobacteria bacterium]|nr:hypothetical protein [Deltaproteobacteria bacterium]